MENIREIIQHIDKNISGRIANKIGGVEVDNVDVLLEFVARADGGNHLEIGTLFGGSAIAVALLKNELFQNGIVMCIDPLDGYYKMLGSGNDLSGFPVTPETLFRNIDNFAVGDRIVVMKSYSDQCQDLVDIKFSTAYIDGDHQRGMPLHDWNYVKGIVNKYVIFDNWDNKHLDVQKACEVANNDESWQCVYSAGITYVVERI